MSHDVFLRGMFSHHKEKNHSLIINSCLSEVPLRTLCALEKPARYPLPSSQPTLIPRTWYMLADRINTLITFSQPIIQTAFISGKDLQEK